MTIFQQLRNLENQKEKRISVDLGEYGTFENAWVYEISPAFFQRRGQLEYIISIVLLDGTLATFYLRHVKSVREM